MPLARVDITGWLLAALLPVLLWHDTVARILSAFRLDLAYLTGWAPWLLMGAGLACFVPVLRERRSEGRFHGRPILAWSGWSFSLYVLGFALATQVAQIAAL